MTADKIQIGKPFTPSKIVKRDVTVVKQIDMTCGGGMGGSHWMEYTKDDFNINDRFIEVWTNRSGQSKSIINTKYIVGVRDVVIVRLRVQNLGNRNIGSVGDVDDYCYVFDNDGLEVEFADDYRDMGKYRLTDGNSRFLDKE